MLFIHTFDGSNRLDRFNDYDARQAPYWSMLSAACGHTYGNNNIWQMYSEKHRPILWPQIPWHEAIDHPGAFQMGILKKFFTSRPFYKLVPNKQVILDGPTSGGAKIKAALAGDATFLIVYSPRSEKISINKSHLQGEKLAESWFDPRYGVEYKIHISGTRGIQTYTPPTSGRGNDWILIIEKVE